VLIVPRSWLLQPVGGRILVAWDGSRESAVALQASLPLLAGAAAVTLVSLREEREAADAGALQISPALAWLNRHGIRAEAEQHTTATGTAEALLFHAARMSADLLVMGAYGHPRLRELMLGGVTRDMLARMNLPVLMAH
jgi:nucleotide-binding universal stress UspA family protein